MRPGPGRAWRRLLPDRHLKPYASLRGALVWRLFAVQALIVFVIVAALVWSPDNDVELSVQSLDDAAVGAIRLNPFRIEETASLRRALAERPQARLAVLRLQDFAIAEGSDVALANQVSAARATHGFISSLDGDGRRASSIRQMPSIAGPVVLVVSEPSRAAADPQRWLAAFLLATPIFAILSGVSAISVWFSVRSALAPVDRAAAAAARIDPERLEDRLPVAAAPSEIRSLLDAVNQALDRLALGFAAQRRFTADAAHELRTPVSILRLRLQNVSDPQLRSALERDVRRLGVRVEQLLAIAKLGREAAPSLDRLDLVAVARTVAADFAPLAARAGVTIDLDAPSHSVWVSGDEMALESIVANLIDNAIRFSPVGKSISVRVTQQGALHVRDEGKGIPEALIQDAFAPFQRLDNDGEGLGLGLAIATRAALAMGGSLEISTPSAAGAEFVLQLKSARIDSAVS